MTTKMSFEEERGKKVQALEKMPGRGLSPSHVSDPAHPRLDLWALATFRLLFCGPVF